MLKTRVCSLLGIEHPVVLGGMAGGTNPELVAAVSNAGGLGVMGCAWRSASDIAPLAAEIRAGTQRPFGLNLLLFGADEAVISATLDAQPPVFSTAWAWPEQDLTSIFARAHDVGARVMHMISTVGDAQRAAEAGADVIVAQGTEGGGHVGVMGTLVLVRQVVRAVAPLSVLAAGGVADGAGLAAGLMLGADGVLLGTRFLATHEAPLPDSYKQAICSSNGHDTLLGELPDKMLGRVWPGAFARVLRNRVMQDWAGRESEVRIHQAEIAARLVRARELGDAERGALFMGQDAGLIDSIEPAGELVQRLVRDAEAILTSRAAEVVAPAVPVSEAAASVVARN